jgi:hypothetical protein
LLGNLQGETASFSGATQIRAGVIRPEIIIATPQASTAPANEYMLACNAPIRIIREPYFGQLAIVAALPSELVRVESGAEVRVLQARLASGEVVTVPRANVELISA